MTQDKITLGRAERSLSVIAIPIIITALRQAHQQGHASLKMLRIIGNGAQQRDEGPAFRDGSTTARCDPSFKGFQDSIGRRWRHVFEHLCTEFIKLRDISQQPVRGQPFLDNADSLLTVVEIAKASGERLHEPLWRTRHKLRLDGCEGDVLKC